MTAALHPLRLPAFRRLAAVRLVDELGDWLGEIALAVLVFDRTGSPLATAALFLALLFVPAIATPPLVARLEAYPSRISLPALNLVQGGAFAAIAMLSSDFSLLWVVLLATLAGALAISNRALTRAAAATVVGPHGLLREGNALLNISFTVGAAAGPAIAGLVVAGVGHGRRCSRTRPRSRRLRCSWQPLLGCPRRARGRRIGQRDSERRSATCASGFSFGGSSARSRPPASSS